MDGVYRLQERNYPDKKVPIILPFLADGILALGGTKSEGIFRVPGDGDLVSELKLRIDKGYYSLDTVDDPHVLASLLKLWFWGWLHSQSSSNHIRMLQEIVMLFFVLVLVLGFFIFFRVFEPFNFL